MIHNSGPSFEGNDEFIRLTNAGYLNCAELVSVWAPVSFEILLVIQNTYRIAEAFYVGDDTYKFLLK